MKYKEYYNFGFWVYNLFHLHGLAPKMEMKDIVEIVEIINPDSYEELSKIIIMNNILLNPKDYYKDIDIFNKIIKYLILSFEQKSLEVFNNKCELLKFIYERKN